MSHNDFIRKTLNLKDSNINFDDNWYSEREINQVTVMFFHGVLTYEPEACYSCGHIFDDKLIKHGFKKSTIKLPSVSNYKACLELKKQRYFCKHCNSTFTLRSTLIDKHCFISNNTKLAIAINVKDKISEMDLAKKYNVSHVTVSRIIDNAFISYKPSFSTLPENLCFDEFKSVKSAAGSMSFIFCDADKHSIVDIVEDRRLHVLRRYFSQYSCEARAGVKRIVIDMYSPYMTLITELFPNAKIIIDRFHIVQLFSRALNKTRIEIMNDEPSHYSKLKKYWKLILKDSSKIDAVKHRYHRVFKRNMTDFQVVEYLLSLSPELENSYKCYQNVLYCIKHNNFKLLETTLNEYKSSVSVHLKKSINTIRTYSQYINNTLSCRYTNGIIEGINNKIKVIKRIAFGYKSYYHFRNRILITQGILKIKTT